MPTKLSRTNANSWRLSKNRKGLIPYVPLLLLYTDFQLPRIMKRGQLTSNDLRIVAMVLTIGFTIFLLAGGLFILVQPNTPLVNRPGGFSFVYPGDIHNQTAQEFVLSIVTFGMGLLILVIVLFIGLRYLALRANPNGHQHSGMTQNKT